MASHEDVKRDILDEYLVIVRNSRDVPLNDKEKRMMRVAALAGHVGFQAGWESASYGVENGRTRRVIEVHKDDILSIRLGHFLYPSSLDYGFGYSGIIISGKSNVKSSLNRIMIHLRESGFTDDRHLVYDDVETAAFLGGDDSLLTLSRDKKGGKIECVDMHGKELEFDLLIAGRTPRGEYRNFVDTMEKILKSARFSHFAMGVK